MADAVLVAQCAGRDKPTAADLRLSISLWGNCIGDQAHDEVEAESTGSFNSPLVIMKR
jgi:hypothetical protein